MDTDRYLRFVADDAATMIQIGSELPRDTPVPSCPGWTLRDLIVHTGIVHRHKAETVAGGWVDGSPPRPPDPDDEDDLFTWFADGVTFLLDVFAEADLSAPSWTWCPHDHTAAWWARRMAHETAIHRTDVELTAGLAPRLDADLAADGVDEVLDEMMIGGPAWGTVTPRPEVISLGTPGRRWGLRFATFAGTSPTSGTVYELATLIHDAEAEPAASVTTDPSTLDLWLWGRADLPEGAVAGNGDLVDQVRQLAAEATQ